MRAAEEVLEGDQVVLQEARDASESAICSRHTNTTITAIVTATGTATVTGTVAATANVV